MAHQIITATAMARNFSDFLNQVRYQGVTLDIKRGNDIVACISPPAGRPGYPLEEVDRLLAELPRLSSDEAADFRRDIDLAVGALVEPANPWEA